MFSLIQQNTCKSFYAVKELCVIASSNKCELLLLQEQPYTDCGRISGLPVITRTIQSSTQAKAAIAILNPAIKYDVIEQFLSDT